MRTRARPTLAALLLAACGGGGATAVPGAMMHDGGASGQSGADSAVEAGLPAADASGEGSPGPSKESGPMEESGPAEESGSNAESGAGGGKDAAADASPTTTSFTLTQASPPDMNPLEGFMPYAGAYTTFPYSLEWFYIPLKNLQTDYTTFDWAPLEAKLDDIASRGHQAVFRVYIDYPNTPYGMPDFLSGVAKNSYTDYGNGSTATSYSPDYGDPNLDKALEDFIAAFGGKYDNDPRIGFITVGLLGFWGEWHTYPHDGWMASASVMSEVLDAYGQAFKSTQLLVRAPKPGVPMEPPKLGFHDDSFATDTLGASYDFWPTITSAGFSNIWQTSPIGGEIYPGVQSCLLDDTSCAPAGNDFASCAAATHPTWMLYHYLFEPGFSTASSQYSRALADARGLGYAFYVPSAAATVTSSNLHVEVTVRNTGAAPFYYPWAVQLGIKTTGGVTSWATSWDPRTVLPGAADTRWTADVESVPTGTFPLLLRVVNPLAAGEPLRFANATQDADVAGWLTLGEIHVGP